jgi:pimeloyl-ACP methyl ester carboxylesterase
MAYQETFVQREQHRIYLRDHPGAEPAIILMHGFPDNLHLYDRLSPYLSPPSRVVLFDFLGWGGSDKPSGYPYTTDNQVGDLDAVITQLGLGQVVLVAHDASGPPAIDWVLAYPQRVRVQPSSISPNRSPNALQGRSGSCNTPLSGLRP